MIPKLFLAISALFIYLNPLSSKYLSPTQLLVTEDEIIICQQAARQIDFLDKKTLTLKHSISLGQIPTGLCLDRKKRKLYVSAGTTKGKVHLIDVDRKIVLGNFAAGHSPVSPTLLPAGRLGICNRFSGEVSMVDLESHQIIKKVKVGREPIGMVYSKANDMVVIAHHLPNESSLADVVSADVTFMHGSTFEILHTYALVPGAFGIRDIALHPDGRFAVIPHMIGRYTLHTAQLEQGWQNTNGFSIIDLIASKPLHTILLDDVHHGASNPWAVKFNPSGTQCMISHAGSHEVSMIDFPGLLKKLNRFSTEPGHFYRSDDPSNTLSFLQELRRRISLQGKGPRGIAVDRDHILVTHFYSDAIEQIKYSSGMDHQIAFKKLNRQEMDLVRKGDLLFHSADQCFESWQSCASCHPDGRVDGLNWDLLNDGLGNAKNTISMLHAHAVPPAMSTGIRENAGVAVRAGMRYIQFIQQGEEDAKAIDAYLQSLVPVSSPYLVMGKLTNNALVGKEIFHREACGDCHSGMYYSDGNKYDIGTQSNYDYTVKNGEKIPQSAFVTPRLTEVWRTAPYLHDGRYYTLEALFDEGSHGLKKPLSETELKQLVEYVGSL